MFVIWFQKILIGGLEAAPINQLIFLAKEQVI